MKKVVLISFGWFFFVLGIIGSFLPILPTTPFLLLSAYFFSKGSIRLYNWLTGLPKIGKSIKDWNEYGIISTNSKIICIFTLISVICYLIYFSNHPEVLNFSLSGILIMVGIFVSTRPRRFE